MIEEIVIRDLGVISEARLKIGPGFTAVTGETGAGKTMVLTALGLLLGERADSSAVRHGAAATQVHGLWKLDPKSSVGQDIVARLAEADVEFDPEELIISRSVAVDGKSRASISARPVPASLLSELGDKLVVVHGQSDQIRLKSPSAQRQALDDYAGAEFGALLLAYSAEYTAWIQAKARLAELKAAAATRMEQATQLREAVAELERANPQPNEDVELLALAERLGNLEAIKAAAAAAHEAISSENIGDSSDVLGLLSFARKQLESGLNVEPAFEALAQQLKELGFQAREVASQLASIIASVEGDADRSLDEIQSRRAILNSLIRKYGPTLDDVIHYRDTAAVQLLDLDTSGDQIDKLEVGVSAQENTLRSMAGELTAARTEAAKQLALEVSAELHDLAMPGSTLVVQLTPADLGIHGADNVSIQLSSYPGAEPRPLGKGASGGELSRIMLAIEVVLAKTKSNPTFIFDEVDAGVGGAAAIEIGKRLARLAKQAQVIVVTHLAQVAAFSNTHLRVMKNRDGEFTSSDVVALTEVARIDELARMLSGLTESELGRAHAAELWQMAKENWPHTN